MKKTFQIGMPWPLNFIPVPFKFVEVKDDCVLLWNSGDCSVQPVNDSSRWSSSGRSLVLDTNCDGAQGLFKETVFRNLQDMEGFRKAISTLTGKGPYGGD